MQNESAEIAQTPAASPSSPSRKLTMFITRDDPDHRQRRSRPRSGSVLDAEEREA